MSHDKTTKVVTDPRGKKNEASTRAPSLILTVGPNELVGMQWKINKKSMTIGRFAESEIQISEPSISKVHARLTSGEGLVVLVDLGATNGTSLNSKVLTPYMTYQLRHNDQIKLGSVILKFLDHP